MIKLNKKRNVKFFLIILALLILIGPLNVYSMESGNYSSPSAGVSSGVKSGSSNYGSNFGIVNLAGMAVSASYKIFEGLWNTFVSQGVSCNSEIDESTTLSYDITGCTNDYIINITADDVVFDCDGHTIQGKGSNGVYVTADNVTVKNCNISLNGTESDKAVYYFNSDNGIIENNTVYVERYIGIYIESSDGNTIFNNNATANSGKGGIKIYSGDDNLIYDNIFISLLYGISLRWTSEGNMFLNNNITATSSTLFYDYTSAGYTNTLIYNNSFGEVMWESEDLSISEAGTLNLGTNLDITNNNIFVNSTKFSGLNQSANLTFNNVIIAGSAYPFKEGIFCSDGECNNLEQVGNNYTYDVNGFSNYSVGDACNQNISSSTSLDYNITGCTNDYIINITADDVVFDCDGHTIQGKGSNGVYVTADNVTVKNCNISLNGTESDKAVYYFNSDNGIIENNTVYVERYIGIYIESSDGNTIFNNNATANSGKGGIKIYSGDDNLIYDNIFISLLYGISLRWTSEGNMFLNNNITTETSNLIYDPTGGSYTNTLIYNNSYGEVKWADKGDLGVTEAGTLYFGSGIDISENYIFVNSSMFNGLNQSANLSFYNITVGGTARAFRNGVACADSVCGGFSNVGNDYYFNVTGFTNYSVGNNTLSEAQNVSVVSSDALNRTNGTLTGSFDYYDGNGDVQSANETRWYNNSVEVSALANLTLVNSGNVSKGENWTFSARVHDGFEWSDWVGSNALTILNSEPVLESISLSENITTLTDINCTINIIDEDAEDTLYANYTWYKDGVANLTGQSQVVNGQFSVITLGYGATTNGDNWSCGVTPYDSEDYGDEKSGEEIIDSCGMIVNGNAELKPYENISCNGTAIIIGSNDVVFDCRGADITYGMTDEGYGIYNYGNPNVSIKNCNITEGDYSASGEHAIYFDGKDSELFGRDIYNNTLTTNSGNSYGVFLSNYYGGMNISENIIITNGLGGKGIVLSDSFLTNLSGNNIETFGNAGDGVYIENSNNNIVEDNIIITNGQNSYGVSLDKTRSEDSTYSNVIKDNNITTRYLGANGLNIKGTIDSEVNNNLINVSDADAIYIGGNSNSSFENNEVVLAGRDGIRLESGVSENNNFTNNSFSGVGGYELNLVSVGNDKTYLIDQVIANYSIGGVGSILYFKDSEYGEIKYLEAINGSGTNLSADVRINDNLIEVDSVSNLGLNQSANLSFYDVSVGGTARAFRNGVACADDVCGEFGGVGDDYYFNVTGFTNYSVGNNTAPESVELVSPSNGDDTILNRTVIFDWNASSDLDGDDITYDLNLTHAICADVYETGITDTNHSELIDCDDGLDSEWEWKVRACDENECNDWSDTWNFSIMSVSIIIVNGSVDFGVLQTGDEVNTSGDGSPYPLTVENNGNVNVNVSIYAQDSLWDTEELNSSFFQFKAGNSSEVGAFDWDNSVIDWSYMQNQSNMITTFAVLNYADVTDLAELDVLIRVPLEESSGNKGSTIVFEAVSNE